MKKIKDDKKINKKIGKKIPIKKNKFKVPKFSKGSSQLRESLYKGLRHRRIVDSESEVANTESVIITKKNEYDSIFSDKV